MSWYNDSRRHSLSSRGIKNANQKDKIMFKSAIYSETLYTPPEKISEPTEQEMEIIVNKTFPRNYFQIEWTTKDGELIAIYGITTKGKKVVDYDGGFELPRQAIKLLKKNGYDTSEVEEQ